MPHDIFKDPVCGMEVSYETAQARSEYDGRTYYFCSMSCKEEFDQNPEKYMNHDQTAHR